MITAVTLDKGQRSNFGELVRIGALYVYFVTRFFLMPPSNMECHHSFDWKCYIVVSEKKHLSCHHILLPCAQVHIMHFDNLFE